MEYDKEVFKFHNQARTDPKSLIPDLRDMVTRFDGKHYSRPGKKARLRTSEGAPAVNELIEFLQIQNPLPPLEWEEELRNASRDHVLDTGPSGTKGHVGTDESTSI